MIIKDINKKIKNTPDNINEELAPISEDYIRGLFEGLSGDDSNPLDYYTKVQTDEKIGEINNSTNTVRDSVTIVEAQLEGTNQNVNTIKSNLSSSENTKYTTENGIKEFECKSGYVDNITIEGETLVNLWGIDSSKFDLNQSNTFTNGVLTLHGVSAFSRGYYTDISRLKPSTTYTLVTHIISNSLVSEDRENNLLVINGNSTETAIETPVTFRHPVSTGYYINKVTTRADFTGVTHAVRTLVTNIATSGSCSLQLVLLEGDHTGKPITYFEGLKSVGQGDKIEVLTYKTDDDMLIGMSYTEGLEDGSLQDLYKITEYIPVVKGDSFCSYDDGTFLLYNSSKTKIGYSNTKEYIVATDEIKFIRKIITKANLQYSFLLKNSKQDKKQILTTLRSLPNGVKDTIEKRGNKYVKVKRCYEFILDNTLTWANGNQQTNTRAFRCDSHNYPTPKPLSSMYCDLFKAKTSVDEISLDEEYVYCNSSGTNGGVKFFVRIANTRLTTVEVESFSEWLSSNPITVVYELETPIITELPNFNPQTFNGGTTFFINSGTIQAEANFEVTNSIGSEIEVLKDKASSLDEDVSNIQKIHYSTIEPTTYEGKDGDLWIIYEE